MFVKVQFAILFGVLTFVSFAQAATASAPKPQGIQDPPLTLFDGDGPTHKDTVQKPESKDDPEAWFPTIAGLLADQKDSVIPSLFDEPEQSGGSFEVKLTSPYGDPKKYEVNAGNALVEGIKIMGNPKAIWPAILRDAIMRRGVRGMTDDKTVLGSSGGLLLLKVLTGKDFSGKPFPIPDLWQTWKKFTPESYPYILSTKIKEGDCKKLKPKTMYAVLSAKEDDQTVKLFNAHSDIGEQTFTWGEIENDLDLITWRADLKDEDHSTR